MASEQEREHALDALRQKLIDSREWESKLKALRVEIKGLEKDFNQTEENIKALQSVGQIIGEVLKQLDEERCTPVIPPSAITNLVCSAIEGRNADRRTIQSSSKRRRAPGTWWAAAPRWTRRS